MEWLRKLLGLELGESRAVEALCQRVKEQQAIIDSLQEEKIKEVVANASTKMELGIYRRRAEDLRKAWPAIYRNFFTTDGIASRTGKVKQVHRKGKN